MLREPRCGFPTDSSLLDVIIAAWLPTGMNPSPAPTSPYAGDMTDEHDDVVDEGRVGARGGLVTEGGSVLSMLAAGDIIP